MDSARSLRYYLIIADEFNVALKLGLISKEEVLKDLAGKSRRYILPLRPQTTFCGAIGRESS